MSDSDASLDSHFELAAAGAVADRSNDYFGRRDDVFSVVNPSPNVLEECGAIVRLITFPGCGAPCETFTGFNTGRLIGDGAFIPLSFCLMVEQHSGSRAA